jgi:hypothetical protein
MEVSLGYTFDEDGLIRLQKDLNHLLNNLNDQNVKSIRTEYCTISAKGGETILDGSLLEMYEWDIATSKSSTTLRLRAGYNKNTSNFEFNLWNSLSTTPTISLDSIGNAVFSGSINTSESVFVGDNIFLGQTGSTVSKGLYFNATTPSTDEAEGTYNMKSAIYTAVNASSTLTVNINSSGAIDMISAKGIYIARNADTMAAGSTYESDFVNSSNFSVNYYPYVILGDLVRHNAWVGNWSYNSSFCSTQLVATYGYVDASAEWSLEPYIKSMHAEQGKMIDEFDSTVGWIPNVLGYVEAVNSSANRRCLGLTGLTIYNQTTSAGDLTIYKHYTDMDLYKANGARSLTSELNFYLLFYIYDLSRINILSTKAMQIELASSSSLGDKYRWLLGGTTTASTLTTGWNVVSKRLTYEYYYAGTFNPSIFKYARISFEVKANSSGKLATLQALGICMQTTVGSTFLNMYPRYDDVHNGGGYRRAISTVSGLPSWGIHRISSTGISLFSLRSLMSSSDSAMYPSWGHSFGEEHVYTGRYNHNNKMEYIVRCKNDEGKLPFVGGEVTNSFYGTSGKYGVYATSHNVMLNVEVNSTVLNDQNAAVMSVNYNDDFKITIWKEDPPVFNCSLNASQITALVEKLGTTQMCSLAFYMNKVIWKKSGMSPIISSCEAGVGAEILSFKYSRR